MPLYRISKKGRGGSRLITFKSDSDFKNFCKKFNLIGYKGNKQPHSKKDWLYYK